MTVTPPKLEDINQIIFESIKLIFQLMYLLKNFLFFEM